MKGYLWISFAKPSGFLGAVILELTRVPRNETEARMAAMTAIMLCDEKGLNPGGEAQLQGMTMPVPPPEGTLNRLITDKAELDRIDEEWYAACAASGVPRVRGEPS